jgi:glycine dehydrogenase subunit 1
VPHSEEDVRAMLAAVGVASVDELFADIPLAARLERPLCLPPGASESEVYAELAALAARNTPASALVSFLGAGVYDHYVPAVVDAIVSRSEFATTYTPYQPERSQGVLQSIFEFQTAICQLTGLDISNASLYDGGTALAEAAFLASAYTGRPKIVVSRGVHPEYRQVLATETAGRAPAAGGPVPLEVACDGDGTDMAALGAVVDDATAAVAVQQPHFFGGLEDMAAAARIAREAGALFVAIVDPLSLGLLQPPGEYGADIAVGEGQAMGNYLNFGGPYLGFMGAREKLMRRMPGRIVGETVDIEGRRGFVLTLQTREQHIRRERATSNICSNQALNALAALVYLSWLGKAGLPELGELCARKADYLRGRLLELPGVEAFTAGPVLREFAVTLPLPASEVIAALAPLGFLAGVSLGRWWPELERVLLVAVTERRTRAQMDAFVAELDRVLGSRSSAAGASAGTKEAPRG